MHNAKMHNLHLSIFILFSICELDSTEARDITLCILDVYNVCLNKYTNTLAHGFDFK